MKKNKQTSIFAKDLRMNSYNISFRAAFYIDKYPEDKELLQELMRMAEARHRYGLKWYDYFDQLGGIEALGKSRSPEALDFLSMIYTSSKSDVKGEEYCIYPSQGSGDLPSYDHMKHYHFYFPFAHKELAKKLCYELIVTQVPKSYGPLNYRPDHELFAELQEIFSKPPHSVIRKAIKDLEKSTGKKSKVNVINNFYGNRKKLLEDYLKDRFNHNEYIDRYSPKLGLTLQFK